MIPKIRVFAKAGTKCVYGGGSDTDKMFTEVRDLDWYEKDVTVWGCGNADCGTCDDTYKVDDVAIMQFTGKYDKGNQEVYLNDIVEDEYGNRYEVVFEGDCLRCNGILRGRYRPKNRWFDNDLTIIGNSHENPELLEVAE